MVKCKKIDVPKDCCYIMFKEGKVHDSEDMYDTTRGEQVIIDRDKKGMIIGIELIDPKTKGCQRGKA